MSRGYGRIVRNADGQVTAIVEHKDASPEQLQIREVNSGLMAAPAGRLREWLLGLGRNNSQREYYLTDVVAGAVKAGDRVDAVRTPHAAEVIGVNDKIQLAQVEAAVPARTGRGIDACRRDRWPTLRASTYAAMSRSGATCSSTSMRS